MAFYNSITLVGNCGNDPEMRYTPNGVPVTTISIAVNDPRFVNGEWKEKTVWFRVICFNKMAERVNEKIQKGNTVLVVGKLSLQRWEDKNTGDKRFTLEVLANKVINFTKPTKEGVEPKDEAPLDDEIAVEDLPF